MDPEKLTDEIMTLVQTGRSREASQVFARNLARHGLGALVEMARLADRNYAGDLYRNERQIIIRAAAQFTDRMVDLTHRVAVGNVEPFEIANAARYLNAIDFAEMRYNLETSNHEFERRDAYVAERALADVSNRPDIERPVHLGEPLGDPGAENRPPI